MTPGPRPASALEVLDIGAEGVGLLAEPQWTDGDRNSKTLFKAGPLRIVLTALRAAAALDNEDPDEAVTLQVLQGEVAVGVAGTGAQVGPGQVACIAPGEPWQITAATDSLLLLAVGRTPDPGDRSAPSSTPQG